MQKKKFEDKELEILRNAIDNANFITGKKNVQSDNIKNIISILEKFLRENKTLCYGGTAINNMNSKIDELDAAGKLPAGIGKALKDSKIGNLEGLVKNSGGKIDSIVNSLQSAPNQTLSQKEGIAKQNV